MEIFFTILVCFILPLCVLIKPIKEKRKNKLNIKDFFKENKYEIILAIILAIGSFVRVAFIGNMPNALNIDEASSGYDSFTLMKYGVDKQGNSLPIVLYAWGSGQSVLYSYIMIPFLLILGGLTEFSMRLPMALAGVVSLYVIYYLFKEIFDDKKVALVAVAFFAICPWHIMKSRWGMECNLFPDLVLWAIFLLVKGIKSKKNFLQIFSFILLGISCYSYATSYMFMPLFVCGLLIYLVKQKEISIKRAIGYLGIVFIISIPLIVYLIINTFGMEQLTILGVTFPKLKANRYEEISTIFSGNIIKNCFTNIKTLLELLIVQNDGLYWNALPQFGLFYIISLPFFIIGIKVAIKDYNKNKYNQFMNIWMICAIIVAAFCTININRINIIWIPCIYYIILGLYDVGKRHKIMITSLIVIYIISFVCFEYMYFTQDFNEYYTFNSGLEAVVEFCKESDCERVYCYYSFKEPFIYFLFYSEYDVNHYIETVEYFSNDGIFDNIKSFGKYYFYLPQSVEEDSIVIVPTGAIFNNDLEYKNKNTINDFDVYEF